MSSAISIGLGVAILSIAASIGFIRVDDATYMQWRMIFASGEGLAIAVGFMLVAIGVAQASH